MSTEHKKCCDGCKNGQPGTNEACSAKLMMEALKNNQEITKTQEL